MKNQPTPTLNKLVPFVADLPEPFTFKDIMAASGMPENPARGAFEGMKNRGWVRSLDSAREPLPERSRRQSSQKLWARTRWFGLDRASASADMQRAGLERLGQCMAGWRAA